MSHVSIIGAGNTGLTMAAHLSSEGNDVSLWNRTPETIADLRATKCIHCHGVIEKDSEISRVSCRIEEVVSDTDIILVTTPAVSHRDIARRLGPYLTDDSCVVLNPGAAFGALEFRNTLIQEGCTAEPLIAEAQTSIYACRKSDGVNVNLHALKSSVLLSALHPEETRTVIHRLPACIRSRFSPARSLIQTSIGYIGGVLCAAPMLLNTGRIESGAPPFTFFHDGITPTIAGLIEKLDQERIAVSAKMGQKVESLRDWLKRSYQVDGDTLYECIHNHEGYKTLPAPTTLQHRFIHEDLSVGLVPLEAVGRRMGLPMQSTGLVIDFASALLNINFRATGRNLSRLGFASKSGSEIRHILCDRKDAARGSGSPARHIPLPSHTGIRCRAA